MCGSNSALMTVVGIVRFTNSDEQQVRALFALLVELKRGKRGLLANILADENKIPEARTQEPDTQGSAEQGSAEKSANV